MCVLYVANERETVVSLPSEATAAASSSASKGEDGYAASTSSSGGDDWRHMRGHTTRRANTVAATATTTPTTESAITAADVAKSDSPPASVCETPEDPSPHLAWYTPLCQNAGAGQTKAPARARTVHVPAVHFQLVYTPEYQALAGEFERVLATHSLDALELFSTQNPWHVGTLLQLSSACALVGQHGAQRPSPC